MPRTIGVIQKPGLFEDLLTRLGVNRPAQPFTLDGEVVPVIIVESGIAFVASPTPPYSITDIFTAGVLTAPAIGVVIADTTGLPVGSYSIQTVIFAEAGSQTIDFQWRNVANSASLWTQRIRLENTVNGAAPMFQLSTRLTIANTGERFRLVMGVAAGVGEDIQGSILARI